MNWPAIATVAAALVAGFFAWYVQAWRFRREAVDQATQILQQHRDPLLRAAFDLQSRLHNIVAGYFLQTYWLRGGKSEKRYAIHSTLWLLGQYFGRVEILRREVQYLDLGSTNENRVLQQRLAEISSALASDQTRFGKAFITFRSDQRAIGEFMVIERQTESDSKRADCLGYSEFVAALTRDAGADVKSSPFDAWATRFTAELKAFAEQPDKGATSLPRFSAAQRRLMDLVDLLDPDRVRYPSLDGRGRLREPPGGDSPSPLRIASFAWPYGDAWDVVERWAGSGYECHRVLDDTRLYVARSPALRGARFEVKSDYKVEISAWISNEGDKAIDGSPRSRRAREEANRLLEMFELPGINGEATLRDRVVGRFRASRPFVS